MSGCGVRCRWRSTGRASCAGSASGWGSRPGRSSGPATTDPSIADAIIANWADVGVRVRRMEWAGDETIPNLQKAQASLAYFPLAMQGTWRQMTNFIGAQAAWNPFKVANP